MSLETILDSVACGIVTLDRKGRFTYANAGAEQILGLTREEICRRTFNDPLWRITSAGGMNMADEDLPFGRVLLLGQGASEVEMMVSGPGGKRILLSVNAEPMVDGTGQIIGAVGDFDDITRQRQVEQDLARSEKKYRLLFENMNEAVACDELVCDPQGRPVDWIVHDVNPAYEAILEIPRDRAVGRKASEIYAPEIDIGPILVVYARVARTGIPAHIEIPFSPDKHLQVSVLSLGNNHFATVTTDITERKRFEAIRERLLAELEATINAIADGVVIYEPSGSIRHMNPTAQKLLGYSPEECRLPLQERLARLRVERPDGTPFPLAEIMQRVLQGETMQGVIMVLRKADGGAVWVSGSAAPVHTPDGQLVGAVGTATDITELHQLQQQREEYLHSISHDLGTPLTVIQGHAQLLQEFLHNGDQGETARFSVASILESSRQMSVMIDELVEAACLEGGQLSLTKKPIRLPAYIDELLGRYGAGLDTGRIVAEIPAGLPPVPADEVRLERILINLLTNALKYSPSQSPVKLVVKRMEREMVVSVSDSGPGIAEEELPSLFTRFFRSQQRGKSPGSGLGLYICRLLVEGHGGRIWADCPAGRGCTFYFSLPLE